MFRKEKKEILDIAVFGAKLCKKYKDAAEGKITLEYSPESFTGTEPQFAAEVCNAVLDVWQPTADDKAIINLPVTVAHSMPHVYANQVEYMCKNLHYRENVVVSLHPHNDRGCAIADSEMGLLAGGDRIEGTLFGNGERTGNVDVVTLALNMYSQGIEPGLDFTNLPEIIKTYEKVTRMRVYERQPYSGQLVFAAFSGSHQDAIAKGMKYREDGHLSTWTVPYLPLDPGDIGREYEADVIRINSQSGKGGIGYILETQYKLSLPAKMREMFGYHVKNISDHAHKELSPKEVYEIFVRDFVNVEGELKVLNTSFDDKLFLVAESDEKTGGVQEKVGVEYGGMQMSVLARGNGRFDCVCEAVRKAMDHVDGSTFKLESYTQHAIGDKSDAQAVSYVCITTNGKTYWGAGIHCDIMQASVNALMSAVNVAKRETGKKEEV